MLSPYGTNSLVLLSCVYLNIKGIPYSASIMHAVLGQEEKRFDPHTKKVKQYVTHTKHVRNV